MPSDKNIFTKKCTFLYSSCQLHHNSGLNRNDANKLSVYIFSFIWNVSFSRLECEINMSRIMYKAN